ncbi:hypothetical protein [uncultured Parolsenella sp.]|uniref:hypothetical protein n=1 Tax=uncultured Parolsenella sp. TaxID=2083008 RepID=UPI0027D998C3|nr:hypothetical protein [uncultured Parolsenella sp.]
MAERFDPYKTGEWTQEDVILAVMVYSHALSRAYRFRDYEKYLHDLDIDGLPDASAAALAQCVIDMPAFDDGLTEDQRKKLMARMPVRPVIDLVPDGQKYVIDHSDTVGLRY